MNNAKLSKLWDSLHSSYWFLPALMAVLAIALAFGMLALDRATQSGLFAELSWVYTGSPDGARTLLSTVAGSMITVAGTVFSITIVAFTLASSQFGPRLLRNFMQDMGNQFVLGTFISTFIYCLLILRTVRSGENNVFVPQISVTVGILLAIASIGVLIYFIDHATTLIQASHVIKEASNDLKDAVDRLFPTEFGHRMPESHRQVGEIPVGFDTEAVPVKATSSGYLQAIDDQRLMKIAKSKDLLLRLNHHPGQFIVHGSELLHVWPGEVNEQLTQQINDAFVLGRERTEQQDVEFPINQLVEVAIRAISPSINDPFTAIRCIDQLSVGLSHLAEREFPSPYRYDDDNQLRVIANPVSFAKLTDAAFNKIRQYGTSDVSVILRLLEAIATIATHTHRQKDRAALLRHAQMIERGSHEGVTEENDQKDIAERYHKVLQVLEP